MKTLFKKRTKQLALRVIKVVDALPRNRSADVLGRQFFDLALRLEQTIEPLLAASPRPM